MIPLVRELFDHMAWADAAIIGAVRAQPGAAEDEELRKLLHHIVVVQRAFHSIVAGRPFDREKEAQAPATLDEMAALFRATHTEERVLLDNLEEGQLDRVVGFPWAAGFEVSVLHALLQMAMHSHSHRGQCATRLRQMGAKPPVTDFILWVRERPAPAW